MGDRSAISTPKDTLGKASRACDNALNVKNFEERAVNGNALPLTDAGMPASVRGSKNQRKQLLELTPIKGAADRWRLLRSNFSQIAWPTAGRGCFLQIWSEPADHGKRAEGSVTILLTSPKNLKKFHIKSKPPFYLVR